MKKKLILCILLLFVIAPPIVNFIVSTPSPVGFISAEKQDVWIGFYGALLSGALTLLGVGKFERNDKRLVVNLSLLNIGRGEARDLTINAFIITPEGEKWETVTRTYKEICTSSGINIAFCKMLTEEEWKKYNNTLDKPMLMIFEIDYYDLVGYHHKLQSTVNIGRFIYMLDENKQPLSHVLVLNPYDSKIINETSF